MTKFTKEVMYQELSIQISCLSMKMDKILELLNQPQEEIVYEVSDKQSPYEDWDANFK